MPIDDEREKERDFAMETRRMQSALLSQDASKVVHDLPEMSIEQMRDAVKRFVVIGPPKDVRRIEDLTDANILHAVLDKFSEQQWLVFAYRPKDSEKVIRVAFQAMPRNSPYWVGLLRRIILSNYPRYLSENDTIGLQAWSLEGRKQEKRKRLTPMEELGLK